MGRGFESSLGYLLGAETHYSQEVTSNGATGVDLWEGDAPAYGVNGTYGDLIFAERAVSIIESHAAAAAEKQQTPPLFLYVALQCAHDPQEVPDLFADLYPDGIYPARRVFNGMSSVIDDAVKNITDALKRQNMWDDTLLLFTSGM